MGNDKCLPSNILEARHTAVRQTRLHACCTSSIFICCLVKRIKRLAISEPGEYVLLRSLLLLRSCGHILKCRPGKHENREIFCIQRIVFFPRSYVECVHSMQQIRKLLRTGTRKFCTRWDSIKTSIQPGFKIAATYSFILGPAD